MALEKFTVNGVSGHTSGAYTDIDEGTDSPNDSDFISSSTDGEAEVINLDFGGPGPILTADTVTAVVLKVRVRSSIGTSASFTGGLIDNVTPISDSTESPVSNTSSFVTYTLTDTTNWDVDWSQTSLVLMNVNITFAQGGMPTAEQWDISAAQLEVTYTPAAAGGSVGSGLVGGLKLNRPRLIG